jgi:hypothetical protein
MSDQNEEKKQEEAEAKAEEKAEAKAEPKATSTATRTSTSTKSSTATKTPSTKPSISTKTSAPSDLNRDDHLFGIGLGMAYVAWLLATARLRPSMRAGSTCSSSTLGRRWSAAWWTPRGHRTTSIRR